MKTIYRLHTKTRTLDTIDFSIVQSAIVSGAVPFMNICKDGYIRKVYRALTCIEVLKENAEPEIFYRTLAR
jgi:hypothetical protein